MKEAGALPLRREFAGGRIGQGCKGNRTQLCPQNGHWRSNSVRLAGEGCRSAASVCRFTGFQMREHLDYLDGPPDWRSARQRAGKRVPRAGALPVPEGREISKSARFDRTARMICSGQGKHRPPRKKGGLLPSRPHTHPLNCFCRTRIDRVTRADAAAEELPGQFVEIVQTLNRGLDLFQRRRGLLALATLHPGHQAKGEGDQQDHAQPDQTRLDVHGLNLPRANALRNMGRYWK